MATLRVLPCSPTASALLLRLLSMTPRGGRGFGAESGWRVRGGQSPPFSSSSSSRNPAIRVRFPTVANSSFYSTSSSSSSSSTSTSPPPEAPPADDRSGAWAAGDRAELRRVFTLRDVAAFAQLTGDTNPVHTPTAGAAAGGAGGGATVDGGSGVDATTAHGRAVVHGVLLLGLVSALLGTRLPGAGCVLATARLRFPAPLLTGDEVIAGATVLRARDGSLLLRVLCTVAGPRPRRTARPPGAPPPPGASGGAAAAAAVVLEGEVLVMLPPPDARRSAAPANSAAPDSPPPAARLS